MNNRLFSLALVLLLFSATASSNQLKDHPSPYLALHGDDPVEWQPWGQAALDMAREENKLLFISSGYFSCHWCHVMQSESYANSDVAKLLNRDFISVKVDRELEPALDNYLIDFVERTRGVGGWPLHVIMTPDGYPLTGFTYSPREQLMTALQKISTSWKGDSQKLAQLAVGAYEIMHSDNDQDSDQNHTIVSIESRFLTDALAMANELEGGFGEQNQFPMTSQLMALLILNSERRDPQIREFIELTLDQMAQQGLNDHLAGGFFRYTVDPSWQTPHYEKMLYTQALMIRLYLLASTELQRPDYVAVAKATADFVLRDMRGRSGAYISSLSAIDASGEEGGSYLWDAMQLSSLLNQDEQHFARLFWGLDVEAGSEQLPRQQQALADVAVAMGLTNDAVERLRDRVQQRLLNARKRNPAPRDTKQLSAWNGLMLSALSELAEVTTDRRYASAAISLARRLIRAFDGQNLPRSMDLPATKVNATLADYAFVSEGLNQAWKLSNINDFKIKSDKILDIAWSRYFNAGGWYMSDTMLIPGPQGAGALEGAPIPSPGAVLIALGGESADLQLAQRKQLPEIANEPFWYPGHLLQARRFRGDSQNDER